MHKLLVASVLLSAGCGTLFNKQHREITMDPGVSVDGATGYTTIDQKEPHTVTYADGRPSCQLYPGISVGWFLLDLFVTGPIGIIVDAVTGDWKVAKGGCPGVYAK